MTALESKKTATLKIQKRMEVKLKQKSRKTKGQTDVSTQVLPKCQPLPPLNMSLSVQPKLQQPSPVVVRHLNFFSDK